MPLPRILSALALSVGLFGAVAAQTVVVPKLTEGSSPASVEQWRNTQLAATQAAANNKASVVFFRPANEAAGPAANIYINGEYQASLLPGAYTQASICPGTNRFSVAYTNPNSRYAEKDAPGQSFNQQVGQVDYYVIRSAANAWQVQPLSTEQARTLIAQSTPQQHHTVPRVDPRACAPIAPVAPVVVTEKFTLDANALFPFDQASLASMLPAGRQSIAQMVATLKQRNIQVDQLSITGHTDPEGSVAYNQALSERRAQAVAQALTQEGIPAGAIRAAGVGKTQPIVADCAARFKVGAERNACNQPNRRVEIDVKGMVTR